MTERIVVVELVHGGRPPRSRGATKNPVSRMSSGPKIRSARTSEATCPRCDKQDTEHIGRVAVGQPITGLMRKR